MSKNKTGLIVGWLLVFIHAVWSVCVALMPLSVQDFMTWVLTLHHIDMPFAIITPFVLANALLLMVVVFIFGYILGWVIGALHNMVMKKKCH